MEKLTVKNLKINIKNVNSRPVTPVVGSATWTHRKAASVFIGQQSGPKCTSKRHLKPCLNIWDGPSTQKNLFEILLNQPEIRLYLPFSD